MGKLFVPRLEDDNGQAGNKLAGTIRFPEQVVEHFLDIKDFAVETCLVVYLQHDYTGHYVTHSVGTEAYTLFDKRLFYKTGLALDAHYAVLIHNHPSDIAEPTDADLAVIRDLERGLEEIGTMHLLDFIIVTPSKAYWSWFEDNDGQGYEEWPLT